MTASRKPMRRRAVPPSRSANTHLPDANMAPTKRTLPKDHNPLMMAGECPAYDTLVSRRRLGQTNLAVKAGQLNTSNATKPENLGVFDYAHLRAPLPKNLISALFKDQVPAAYFLMRRSQDGYISATGMFKATFPWATLSEEEAERKYVKSLETTSADETAGNVWIPPTHALQLAKEYKIDTWIEALLDNEPIEINPSNKDVTPKSIATPPKFLQPQDALAIPTPSRSSRPVRSTRSASPSKASPKKAIATPRKSKKADTNTTAANKSLQAALKQAATDAETITEVEDPKIRVNVDTDVVVKGETETTHTHVEVEMPAGFAELPMPEDTEAMISKAKEMVDAAVKADNAAKADITTVETSSRSRTSKRKAEDITKNDEEEEADTQSSELQPVKKAKIEAVETNLKTEKVKTRALIGLSATLAIGAIIPYVFGAF